MCKRIDIRSEVNCQEPYKQYGSDNNNMATTALMKVTVLDKTLDKVLVTAACTPPTSLVIRLCRSPVLEDE